jgi:light-regulated signal transduction histidine kinase (bacteriophytochrome)
MTPRRAAITNPKRSLQGGKPSLATIQESIADPTRDIEASHLSPACTDNSTQVGPVSPAELDVSSAEQPIAYRSNGHESDPLHFPHDTTQDTIFCTSEDIQGFGMLFVLESTSESDRLLVQAVSDNSNEFIGRTPSELLSLESFTSIINEAQIDEFFERIDSVQLEETDAVTNRLEAFPVSMRASEDRFRDFWCVMHQTDNQSTTVICEFELYEEERTAGCQGRSPFYSSSNAATGSIPPKDYTQTIHSQETSLIGRRSGKKRECNSVAMDTLNILSRVQDRLATAPDVASLLGVTVDTMKELTGFHRVMAYQFDKDFNAQVVTEHADAKATTGAYIGRTFAASEFTRESGESHKLNKLRMLYDRDAGIARLVCSASKAFQRPLNLAYSYLRAMSDVRLKSLANQAVRSSISISISTFDKRWGLVVCHSYGLRGMRVPFPMRRICYLLSDMVSRNMERFSYLSQLRAKNLVNTLPTLRNPSGSLGTSLEPLLKLLHADFGILSVRNTTQVFGPLEQPQEALVVLAYLRLRTVTSVLTSTNVKKDFLDLRCPFGLHSLGGVLAVPLSNEPKDFVVFFRKPQPKGLGRASDPDDALIDEGIKGYSLRKKSMECQDWTEEEVEIASVFAYVYAKLIAIWGYDEAISQSSRLTQLLLANAAHEIRTPLNAVINYLELALEGSLEKELRKKLQKSQHASKRLLRFVHELLKLIAGHMFGS